MSAALAELAAALLTEARVIDPGIGKASTYSANARIAERLSDVRDHAIAYGIRHALVTLGLYPDASTSCAYPDGDQDCDPKLCPPECFTVEPVGGDRHE